MKMQGPILGVEFDVVANVSRDVLFGGSCPQDALARAIDYLGAVEVAPEHYGRRLYAFAHRPGGPKDLGQGYFVGNSDDLIRYCQGASTRLVMLPVWWTPEQQFLWVLPSRPKLRHGKHCEACLEINDSDEGSNNRFRSYNLALHAFGGSEDLKNPAKTIQRITASLETGEEVPA